MVGEYTRNYVAHVDGKQIYMNLLNLKFPFEIRKISFICKSTRLKQNSFNKLTLPSKPLNRPIKQYTLALYMYTRPVLGGGGPMLFSVL